MREVWCGRCRSKSGTHLTPVRLTWRGIVKEGLRALIPNPPGRRETGTSGYLRKIKMRWVPRQRKTTEEEPCFDHQARLFGL